MTQQHRHDLAITLISLLIMTYAVLQTPGSLLTKAMPVLAGSFFGGTLAVMFMRYQFYAKYAWWRAKCWVRHCMATAREPAMKPASRQTMSMPVMEK